MTGAINGDHKSIDNSGLKTVMDELVNNGTINMAQGVVIQTAITIANQDAAANGQFNLIDNGGSKYVMDGLVKDGTITIAQEVTIQNAITKAEKNGSLNKTEEIFKTQ